MFSCRRDGVYLARSIVESHGGAITAESRVNEGSTFTVRLPRTPPARFMTAVRIREAARALVSPPAPLKQIAAADAVTSFRKCCATSRVGRPANAVAATDTTPRLAAVGSRPQSEKEPNNCDYLQRGRRCMC